MTVLRGVVFKARLRVEDQGRILEELNKGVGMQSI